MLGVEAASTDAASSPTAASPSDAPSVEAIGTRFGAMTVAAWSPSSRAASLARRRTRTSMRRRSRYAAAVSTRVGSSAPASMMKPGMRIGTRAGAAASAGIRSVCTRMSVSTASRPTPSARPNDRAGTGIAGTACCSMVRWAPTMSSPKVSNVPWVGTMSAKLVAPPKSRVSMSSSTTSSSTGTSDGGVRMARNPRPENRVPAAMNAHSHHHPLPEISGPSAIVAIDEEQERRGRERESLGA